MRKQWTVAIILGVILSLGQAAIWADKEPNIRFEVTTQEEIKADGIQIQMMLSKKGSFLDQTTDAAAVAIKRVQGFAREQGIATKDIRIENTMMSASEWIFGKDFTVNSSVMITIRDFDHWGPLVKKLTQLDPDLKFVGVSYVYPKTEAIWTTLFTKAMAEIYGRKLQYEQVLKSKLGINTLHETRIRPFEEPHRFLMRKAMTPGSDTPEAPPEIGDILPSQRYQLNFEVGLDIQK